MWMPRQVCTVIVLRDTTLMNDVGCSSHAHAFTSTTPFFSSSRKNAWWKFKTIRLKSWMDSDTFLHDGTCLGDNRRGWWLRRPSNSIAEKPRTRGKGIDLGCGNTVSEIEILHRVSRESGRSLWDKVLTFDLWIAWALANDNATDNMLDRIRRSCLICVRTFSGVRSSWSGQVFASHPFVGFRYSWLMSHSSRNLLGMR